MVRGWRPSFLAEGVVRRRRHSHAVDAVVLPIVFLYNAIDEMQPFPDKIGWLFYVAARSLFIVVVVNALMTTVLSPSAPEWRLIPAGDRAALRITRLVLALVILYGLMTFVYSATRTVQSPFSLTLALTLPANLLVAALVVAILKTPLEDKDVEGMPSLTWLRLLRLPLWGLSLAIVVTAFAGYLALSRFIAQQLIVTGSILALVYLLLLWADGYAQGMRNENSAVGSWLKGAAALDQDKRERLSVPVSLLLKLAVLVASVPLILLQWGYPWPDIIELYRQLFFGFRIGTTEISLAAIFASIIVFVLGYFAAKLFQGWLDRQVLKPAGLSGGLRDLHPYDGRLCGHFRRGVACAFLRRLQSFKHCDRRRRFVRRYWFGPQAVVSNFVSGLILLAERPIKIGDLVTVGGEEGYVRKISVRSTEIETFDRANVLIPNSSFITEKVKNWTLRNNTARVAIPVACGAWQRPAARESAPSQGRPGSFECHDVAGALRRLRRLQRRFPQLQALRLYLRFEQRYKHQNRSADRDSGSVQGQRYRPALAPHGGPGSTRWNGSAMPSINIWPTPQMGMSEMAAGAPLRPRQEQRGSIVTTIGKAIQQLGEPYFSS